MKSAFAPATLGRTAAILLIGFLLATWWFAPQSERDPALPIPISTFQVASDWSSASVPLALASQTPEVVAEESSDEGWRAPGRPRFGSDSAILLVSAQEEEPPADPPAAELPMPAADEPLPAVPEADAPEKIDDMPPMVDPLERRIVFSFSKAPWDVALTRFAELAELQLILKFKPPGTFDYASSKSFTIPEALDILNEVLIAEGFVVLRTDRFLTLAALDQPLPLNQVPVVPIEDLPNRGRNEFVTVVKRLQFADPATLEPEIKKLLGEYGIIQAVPSLKMIRVTEQVSKLIDVLPLIDELDNAAKPKSNPAPANVPKTRKSYPLAHLAPAKAITLIKTILSIAGTIEPGPDDKSILAVLTEPEHESVAVFLKEIDTPTSTEDQPAERSFTLAASKAESVVSVLRSLYPEKESGVTVGGDSTANVIAVKGPGRTVEQIAQLIEALETQAKANSPTQEIYPVGEGAAALSAMLESAFPRRDNPGVSFAVGADRQSILVTAPAKVQALIKDAIGKLGRGEVSSDPDQTEVVQLEHASATKLAATLTTVFAKSYPPVSIGSEEGANALVIRAPAARIEKLKQLVKDLDLAPNVMGQREREEAIYEPKHARAADLVKTAESLYPTATNVVFVPAAGNKIVVSASPVLMAKVKATLDLLDRAAETTQAPTDKSYTLRHAKPSEIIRALSAIFPTKETEIRFVPDDSNNRLFVVTPDEKLHARVAELINQIDIPADSTETIEIYTAKNVPASALVQSLTKLFATEASKPSIQIQRDNKSILIRATRDLHERMVELLTKIDVASEMPLAEPTDELYKLKYAKAADLVTALQKLYPPDLSDVQISAEPANNILIISAPPEVHERIRLLLEKVDVPSDARMKLEIYAPENVSPAQVATLISSLNYQGVGTIVPASDGRSLLAIANEQAHEKIKRLVELLGAQESALTPIRKTYTLENVTASGMVTTLQTLFPASGASPATIVADPSGKQLIVQASEKTQAAIAEIIKQADVPSPLEQFTVTAKNVMVVSLYTQIYSLFAGTDGTRVTYDIPSNSVGIVATPAMKEKILAMVEKFDQPLGEGEGRKREIYKIKNSLAVYVYTGLVALFPASETGVSMIYDSYNNLVVVTATDAQQARIKAEIARLDVSPRGDWLTKSFRPVHTGSPELVAFLTQQLASVTDKAITAGAHGKDVVVSAKPTVMEEVERLVKVFDVPPPEDEGRVRRIYRPTFANVSYLALNLQTAFPKDRQVDVSSDPYSLTVTVVAPALVQEEIAKAIAELDQDPRKSWIEKSFEPKHLTAIQLMQVLTTSLSNETNKSIAAAPDGKKLIAVAPPAVMERIERLVATLDTPPDEEGRVRRIYRPTFANVSYLAQNLLTAFPKDRQVDISSDPYSLTVTVVAPPLLQEEIAKAIAELDQDPRKNWIEKSFEPKNMSSTQLLQVLTTSLSNETNKSLAAAPDGQKLIAVAPPQVMERIERLVATLDTPPTEGGETTRQLYRLNFASARDLAQTLPSLYPPAQFPIRVSSESANNVLVVEAPAALQEKIATLVKELDVPQGGRSQVVYHLNHTRAGNVLTSLRNILSGSSASVVAGPDDKSLVVNALPTQQEQVKGFLADFDKAENSQDPESKVYKLRFATASNVSRMIGQLYSNETSLRVTYDDVLNSVYVTGTPDLLRQIEQVVNDADTEGAEAELVSEVFRVRDAQASDVSRSLTVAFSDRKKATFVPDTDAGTIFVRAQPALMDEIRKTIEELDRPREKSRREIVVFDLFEVDPFEAGSIIEEIFTDVPADDRPKIETTFEPPRLIVRATAAQMMEVREVLTKLEGEDVGGAAVDAPNEAGVVRDKPVERVIRLNNADSVATMKAIEESWPLLRQNKLNVIRRQSPLDALNRAGPEKVPDDAAPPKDEAAANALPGDPNLPVNIIVGNDRLTASSRDVEALDLMQSLAEAWTEPFDPERSASRVFYIENGDVAEIAEAIDEAFNGRQRGDGERRRFRTERVRIVAEPNANALIVRASPIDLVNVKELIDSLDLAPAADKKPRIIPLKQADANEVLTVIKQVFSDYLLPGSGPPLAVPGVRATLQRSRTAAMSVDVDPRSNSLIVSAPETVMADVEELVDGLEKAAADTQKSYRVIPIENASPADVRGALEILLDRQLQSTPSSRPTRNRRPVVPRTSRPRTTSEARPEDQTPKIEPLDSSPKVTQVATIGGKREKIPNRRLSEHNDSALRTVGADEDDLTESELINAAAQELEEQANTQLGAMSGTVEISVLEDVGALLLLGTEKDLETLEEIVREIERINKVRELSIELYPLEHTKALALANLLNDVYGRLQDARGIATRAQAQTAVVPLAKPNALLLVAPKDEIANLLELAKKFDVATTGESQFRLFRLKHIRAVVLAQTIESFYAGREQDGELATDVVVEADDRSNSLIAYAGPRDLDEVARLVEELDTSKTSRVNDLKIFYLKHTVAPELATTLQTTLQAGQLTPAATAASQRGAPSLELIDPENPAQVIGSGILEGVTITPNRRANALIVSAPKDVMKLVESLIERLDVLPEAVAQIKVFTLVNSAAATMVQTLRSLFAPLETDQNRTAVTPTTKGTSETSPLIDLSFSVDERTNSILVSGSKEQLEVVEAIVLRLDGSDIEERKSEVYRLKNAPADEVATALTELLTQQQQLAGIQEGQSLQQQLEQEVIVVPEMISNSLLISASPRYFDQVIQIIEKLDELPPQVVIQVLLAEVELDEDAELGVELGLQDGLLFQRSNQNSTAVNKTGTYYDDGSTPGFNFNSGGPLGDNIFAGRPDRVAGQGLSNFGVGRSNSALGFGGLILSASSESVSVLIRALARERRLEVLSRPQIMTLDNQTASIVVGAEVPRITGSNLVQGAGVTQNIEYVPSGIILEVTPKINPDGTVVMNVSPEISRLAPANDLDQSVTISPGVVARALEITKAETTVSTMSGQTVIIGGLIRKSMEREERKVPCLGDLPVAGHLFRYDLLSERRSELLIILTPHVVRNQADAEQIKATEAARMNWCLSAVEKIHGDIGLPTEVYLGECADDLSGSEEVIDEQVIETMPLTEESEFEQNIPSEPEMSIPSIPAAENPAKPLPQRKAPFNYRVEKPPVSETRAELGSKPPTEVMPPSPEEARQKAKALRAEKDAAIFRRPMENRRAEFDSWKNRNLPWKREKAAPSEPTKK